ncbi:MAG TPA: hypothetical protein DCQ68_08645 [Chryseobacterium indologenes]|uniref:hypothetical protein n=1 Tax=Chryseobacterium indologenes TaxID=253 RepID=UPI000ECAC58D|nr:hypothetical protein [Chryseobacterium indologenes]QIX80405.1 hypothetical protein FOB56_03795 [Chryseobacterium indologenes]UDQ54059.1 hypothetical protein LJF28_22075 [Chryseobacterium indologenes]HAO27709.1 hypothetical protein [Chryseobacterium indologenes]
MRLYLLPLLISIIAMSFTTIAAYNIMDFINPPMTEDSHENMPMENVIESLFLGFLAFILSFYVSLRALRQRKKNKYPFNQLYKNDL